MEVRNQGSDGNEGESVIYRMHVKVGGVSGSSAGGRSMARVQDWEILRFSVGGGGFWHYTG